MSKKVKDEWKQYLLDEEKDYTEDELVEKFKRSVDYMKSKHIRINPQMLIEAEDSDLEFHLTEQEKIDYEKMFRTAGYTLQDCKTIVNVMDSMYHILDISKEDAKEFTLYAVENNMTLTDAISRKYGIFVCELNDYMESVLKPNMNCCAKKIVKLGKGKTMDDILTFVFVE